VSTDLYLREECERAVGVDQPETVKYRGRVEPCEATTPPEAKKGAACVDARLSDGALAELALSSIERGMSGGVKNAQTTVRGGWLILEGEVETPQQKRAVEEVVRHLGQIRGISNNIALEADALTRRVSRSIDEKFAASAHRRAHRILVTASDHRIILSGTATAERDEAEAAAWQVPGVAYVVNRIRPAA
jgi:osmotically-inducible protein OsmY